jgi:soluble lytic murein transglycosylase-like protein
MSRTQSSVLVATLLSSLAFSATSALAAPYEKEIIAASDRVGVDSYELGALIDAVSGFDPNTSGGLGAFTGIAAKEVARLAGLREYSQYYGSSTALLSRLATFSVPAAREPALAIEGLALFFRSLLDRNDDDSAAALAAYKSGSLAASAVRRHGLNKARSSGLLDRGVFDFINKVLGSAQQRREEARAIEGGRGPVASAEEAGAAAGTAAGVAAASASAPTGEAALSPELRTFLTSAQPRNRTEGVTNQHDPRVFDPIVFAAADRHGLDRNLLRAVIQTESKFDPGARSYSGAAGLGQFTGIAREEIQRLIAQEPYASRYAADPAIVRELQNFNLARSYNPQTNVEATALLLRAYLDQYNGNVEAALTAYNAGYTAANAVRRHGHAKARRLGLLGDSQAATYAPEVLENKAAFDRGVFPERVAGPEFRPVTSRGAAGALGEIGD